MEAVTDFIFLVSKKSLQTVTADMKLKDATPWKDSYEKPRQCFKKQRHNSLNWS